MATITLKEGDFGGEAAVTVGEAALYLPDRARPGLNELVPLTAVAEIESIADDRSGQLKEAARLGVRGLLATGNPLGFAAGMMAVRKVKDVEFSVSLKDGRRFVAIADVITFANLRAACRTAHVVASEDAEAAARADAVIAKYVGPDAVPLARQAPAIAVDQAADADADADAPDAASARRVFGRRGLR